MATDPNASAFPVGPERLKIVGLDGSTAETRWTNSPGLSVRAYIATKVLAGLVSAPIDVQVAFNKVSNDFKLPQAEVFVTQALLLTDALIAELNEENTDAH